MELETCPVCGDLYPANDLESAQKHLHGEVEDLELREVKDGRDGD